MSAIPVSAKSELPSCSARRGFTLIELMVVVAVIGILTMIAYPSYQSYVIRGNRSQAQQFLMDIAQREEQFRLDQGRYTSSLTDLGSSVPAQVAKYYQDPAFDKTDPPAARPFFVAELAPLDTGAQKNDGRLFINSLGEHWRDAVSTCAITACASSDASAIPWE